MSRTTVLTFMVVSIFLASCILYLASENIAFSQDAEKLRNPYMGNEEAASEGKHLFRAFCTGCHGMQAEGGKIGPTLANPRWLYGWTDEGMFQVISNGVPGSSMQKFGGKLTHDEIWKLIAHLRMLQSQSAGVSLNAVAANENWTPYIEGDPKAGEALFFDLETTGCAKCHVIKGRGERLGPDLTYIGSKRSSQFIMESILKPSAYIAYEYETTMVITKDGRIISGLRRNEDETSLQVLDSAKKLWTTYFKDQVEIIPQTTSLMPANYSELLTVQELHDLLAYLMTLK